MYTSVIARPSTTVVAVLALFGLAVGNILVGSGPAAAIVPGENGRIYVEAVTASLERGNVYIEPDGTVVELEFIRGGMDGAAASPDGRSVLNGDGALLLTDLVTNESEVLVEEGRMNGFAVRADEPTWAPDRPGTFAYLYGGELTIGTVDDPGGRTLDDGEEASIVDMDWIPGGTIIASYGFADEQFIRHIDVDAGESRRVDMPVADGFPESGGVSPDGSQIVYTCEYPGPPPRRGDLTITVDGACFFTTEGVFVSRIGLADFVDESNLQWSPDGQHLLFTDSVSEVLYSAAIDGSVVRELFRVDDVDDFLWLPLVTGPPPTEAPLASGGFDDDPTTTERADFTDTTAYAVAVSQARFDDSAASHAVLSRNDTFPDSLAGAALTGEGPLLFTTPTVLPPSSAAEIRRVVGEGGRVYIMGGVAAVSAEIEEELDKSFDVVRLAGPSRVETSVAVAREVVAVSEGDSTTIAIARAGGPADNPTAGWADSVSVGAWTAAASIPTVVTPTESVHPAVAAFLDEVGPDRTVLLGGTAALSTTVEENVPEADRVSGPSRAATASAIATDLVGLEIGEPRSLVIINGYREDGWLFGLPAAGLAADAGAALAVVNDGLLPETEALACDSDNVELFLAGGLEIINETTARALETAQCN